MSNTSSQDKTEKATQKKKRDAKKKGQIPRSRELVNFTVLVISAAILYLMSMSIIDAYHHILIHGFLYNSSVSINKKNMFNHALVIIRQSFLTFMTFPIILLIFIYLSNIAVGGHSFSIEKILPKISNISPSQGIKKIFSVKGVQELIQSLLKCLMISVVCYLSLKNMYPIFIKISLLPVNTAMKEFLHYFLSVFFFLSISTIVIVFIDVPWQIFQHQKKLRMSKQELKDEYKQTEGNPQIKSQLRRQQRRASKRRQMFKDLPKANIIVANPTHFAVALQYDEEVMDAPVIVVMGADLMALHIRRLSAEYKIPVLEIPLLARALYYNGEVGEEIPELLFHAVAQVIAYIYKLDDPLSFHLDKYWIDRLPIPKELIT